MAILDNVLNRFGFISQKQYEKNIQEAVKRELAKIPFWLGETADAQRWNMPSGYTYATQADIYRLSPVLGTALDIVMDDVGLSKFNVKKIRGERTTEVPNHEFELLLRNPNPADSGLEFMRDSAANYKLNGNCVWWLNRTAPDEKPMELWTMPFSQITPIPDGRLYVSHYEYNPGNGKGIIPIPTWQIVHFKTYNPNNRFVGLSPIESLALTLQGNQGMRQTKTTMYTEYGGAPQSILSFKDWVPDEAWQDIKSEKRQAAMRNEMLMLRGTGDGVSWMARTVSSKDAEFIENMKQDMTDIFNRMCPGLLAMLDANATEANALAARATYSEKTLWKTLEVFAQKITSDILPAYETTQIKLIGEFEDPRVVDRKLELEEQTAFERSHTLDEVRKEMYEDSPIGDERGELLISQIKADSGQPTPPANPVPPVVPDVQNTDNTTEPMPMNDGADLQVKAALDALTAWRRVALRGKTEKAKAFTNPALSSTLTESIKAQLGDMQDLNKVSKIFKTEMDKLLPKEHIDPVSILKAIELGVRALEAKG